MIQDKGATNKKSHDKRQRANGAIRQLMRNVVAVTGGLLKSGRHDDVSMRSEGDMEVQSEHG